MGRQEQEKRWGRLRKEMEGIRERGELCLLVGDQNKHIGADHLGVPGNHARVSAGGRLVRDLLATGDWVLVNGMGDKVVEGGPFTREDPATGERSCLSLFIVSKELEPFVKSLYIDSTRTMGVARPVWEKGKFRLVYPDHFPCLLTLQGLPWKEKKVSKEKKKVCWNLAKYGGWNRYKVLTDECSEALNEVIGDNSKNVEEITEKFDKIHEKVKFRSFGKVTLGEKKVKTNQMSVKKGRK